MAIQYAGGTNVNAVSLITTRASMLSFVNTQLISAGWSSSGVKAQSLLTCTANPTNNETVTLDGLVYTFKTTINNANQKEVLIGAALADSLTNLKACINLTAGSGTLYSSATTIHPTIEGGTLTATTLVVQQKTAAVYSGLTVSETLANGSFNVGTLGGAGYKLTCTQTAQFQQIAVFVQDYGETSGANNIVRMRVANVDESKVSHAFSGSAIGSQLQWSSGGTNWRLVGCKYQMFLYVDSPVYTQLGFFGCGVPYIETFQKGKQVTSASNATPVVIGCTAHGYSNGNTVYVTQVGGNTAANGQWVIANVTANTFELSTSVGNGAYTSGGVVGKVNVEVAEAMWMVDSANGTDGIFRNNLAASTTSAQEFLNINGATEQGAAGGTKGGLGLVCPIHTALNPQQPVTWYNTSYIVNEPLIGYAVPTSGNGKIIGQLWDAVVMMKSETGDLTATFDSHNWINLTCGFNGTTSQQQGSLLVVVP